MQRRFAHHPTADLGAQIDMQSYYLPRADRTNLVVITEAQVGHAQLVARFLTTGQGAPGFAERYSG